MAQQVEEEEDVVELDPGEQIISDQ